MTIDEATASAFKYYKSIIEAKGIKPVNHADDFTPNMSLEHALWMCNEILNPRTSHYSIDKKSRWLGFVQCILIMNNITTIKAERDITRPWFTNK